MDTSEQIQVAVLIDHRPNHPGEMGGLAGTWEQVSRIAIGRTDLDLTVFFLGDERRCIQQGENVRHVLIPPTLGTERLPFLRGIPTNTDLAPLHPRLLLRLKGFHLLHTTDAFHAFAKSALWASRLYRIPLVNSIQTDIIGWARIYTPRILEKILPGRALLRLLLDKCQYLDRQECSMERRFGRYMRACAAAFISHDRDRRRIRRLAPSTPVHFLRRGIDLEAFHPRRRDRALLHQRWGVPLDRTLLLFVGRIDPVKGAMVAAQTVQRLLAEGLSVHLLVAGEGAQRQDVASLLGDRVTLTGNIPHADLGWVYASADLLLFPSEAEVWPNVVIEARASGLPVMACSEGASHVMEGSGKDGTLLNLRDPKEWCSAARTLLDRPEDLAAMGQRARRAMEERAPSWKRVLEEDLLPVWREVAGPRR